MSGGGGRRLRGRHQQGDALRLQLADVPAGDGGRRPQGLAVGGAGRYHPTNGPGTAGRWGLYAQVCPNWTIIAPMSMTLMEPSAGERFQRFSPGTGPPRSKAV